MTAGNLTYTSMTGRTRQQSAKSNKPGVTLGKSNGRIKQLGSMPTKEKLGQGDQSRPLSKTILKLDRLEDTHGTAVMDMDHPILEKDDNLERSDDFDNSNNNRTAEDIIRQIENEDDLADKKDIADIQNLVDS